MFRDDRDVWIERCLETIEMYGLSCLEMIEMYGLRGV